MVFTDGCIFSARLRSDFCSDQVDTSNAAVQCRRGRMEMQQSALILTSCAPNRDVRFTSMN